MEIREVPVPMSVDCYFSQSHPLAIANGCDARPAFDASQSNIAGFSQKRNRTSPEGVPSQMDWESPVPPQRHPRHLISGSVSDRGKSAADVFDIPIDRAASPSMTLQPPSYDVLGHLGVLHDIDARPFFSGNTVSRPLRREPQSQALATVYRLSTNGGAEATAIEISSYF